MRLFRPIRRLIQRHQQKISSIHLEGTEFLAESLKLNHGVLITPNHFCYADVFGVLAAADAVKCPPYFMAAWQVLGTASMMRRLVLRWHGVFSVDREGSDLRAFRKSVEILQTSPHPLVIFPEGDMYHVNERVMPFEEGPAAIALTAAKRAKRSVVCMPCSLVYRYVEDPMPKLLSLMDRLEERFFWRPRLEFPLSERIYHFVEGLLALKELEYIGNTQTGMVPDRIRILLDCVLTRLEQRYSLDAGGSPTARIKSLRRAIRERLETAGESEEKFQVHGDLNEVFLAVQLYCYPGDYVSENPTTDRMAETLDKFEEDVFGVTVAKPRAKRELTVTFDEPIVVTANDFTKQSLTELLEGRVQSLLNRSPQTPAVEATSIERETPLSSVNVENTP